MSSYLITNYKGIYQLQAEIDQNTGDFCRDKSGDLENFSDIWITCSGKGKIFHFGGNKLQYYSPSLGRGHNIIKAIYECKIGSYDKYIITNTYTDKNGEEKVNNTFDYESLYKELSSNGIIFDIEETDEEILFKFKAANIKELESFLKPSTFCKDRSPFSVKNIRKLQQGGTKKYSIPLEELNVYKEISAQIHKDDISVYNKINKEFTLILSKKSRTNINDLKNKIKLSGMKPKEYFHSMGEKVWNDYLDYMRKYIKENIK